MPILTLVAFLVVGESLVDLISRDGSWSFAATPGGSPLNVAVGLAADGHEVRLASEVGTDLFGGLLRSHLETFGVSAGELVDTPATSVAFARVDAAGAATYDFRFTWAYAGKPDLTGVDCVHTGSLATAVAPGDAAALAVVEAARRAGALVSYDPNIRPALVGDRAGALARVEEIVRSADVVKVSDEDLRWLCPDEVDVAVARRWLAMGPRLVVVTRGGEGAVAVHDGLVTVCAAPPVTVADTVGAGDAFTTGLLSSLGGDLAVESVTRALRYASATAAAVCSRPGALPPPRAEVDSLLPGAVIATTTA
ncbi:carbohydrate kinase [Phytohabitans houttuyneae]|uniref:Ribokinase n=1 Tax=Phytohabitans houttuyneae TaxID=1076126 RepID=A0A6V8KA72_9ACTN|nr:ribokinase [Phytohabitans houttuyneae]